MTDEPILRLAARVLLLDDRERTLLFRYAGPEGQRFWATPGGALDPAETHEQAARRELREEAGVRDIELGPWIWTREHVFPWGGKTWRQQERFFLARLPGFEVQPDFTREMLRAEGIVEHRWWTLAELERATEDLAPRRLAELVGRLLRDGPPPEPVDVGV